MPGVVVDMPADVEALRAMTVAALRALCDQLAVPQPAGRPKKADLVPLLEAKIFPGPDPEPADPEDVAAVAALSKAELQALCGRKGLDATASAPKMRELVTDLLFPVDYPNDETSVDGLEHDDLKRVLRRAGLRTTGGLADVKRRVVAALFPPTPETADELSALPLIALQRLCEAQALPAEGVVGELRDRLKEHLGFLPVFDRRSEEEQLFDGVSPALAEVLTAAVPVGTAAWAALALRQYLGSPAVVTPDDLTNMVIVVPETVAGAKGVPVLPAAMRMRDVEYVTMRKAFAAALLAAKGPPPGVGLPQAEQASEAFLAYARSRMQPSPVAGAEAPGRESKVDAILEKLAAGTSAPRTEKYGAPDFAEAVKHFKAAGSPLDRQDMPQYTQMARFVRSVQGKVGGEHAPQLPLEREVQPDQLRPLVDVRTGMYAVEAGKKLSLSADDGLVVRAAVEGGKKGNRSVYEVAQGVIMYVTGVYAAGVGLQLPEGSGYETMVPGKFATPFYLVRFVGTLRRLASTTRVSAAALDSILTQLVHQAQVQVNDNEDEPWSADTALSYLTEKVVEQVTLAGTMASPAGGRGREDARLRPEDAPGAAKRAKGGGRAGEKKCKTCETMTTSLTGVCGRCRGVKPARGPAGAAKVGGK